jgi:hypothetical protein
MQKKTPETHLTHIDDLNAGTPTGPPLATTHGLVLPGAWCCPILNVLHVITTIMNLPKANKMDDEISHGMPMPPLGPGSTDDSTGEIEDDEKLCFDRDNELYLFKKDT